MSATAVSSSTPFTSDNLPNAADFDLSFVGSLELWNYPHTGFRFGYRTIIYQGRILASAKRVEDGNPSFGELPVNSYDIHAEGFGDLYAGLDWYENLVQAADLWRRLQLESDRMRFQKVKSEEPELVWLPDVYLGSLEMLLTHPVYVEWAKTHVQGNPQYDPARYNAGFLMIPLPV